MPELPEVETVLRALETQIKGKTIQDIFIYWDNIIQYPSIDTFKERLINQSFDGFKRRGKYLIFKVGNTTLISHLRMEGKFFVKSIDEPIEKHTHVVFVFDDKTSLRYNDVRKFGKMSVYKEDENLTAIHGLGKEPFDKELVAQDLYMRTHQKTISIKQVLLDQSYIAGIGNIYADEICFACKIHPNTKVNTLTEEDWEKIIQKTRMVLQKAIDLGGTTIRSYTSSLGVTGRFQLDVMVHTRKGEPCRICQTPIVKTKVATRGTYYCPTCQKERI